MTKSWLSTITLIQLLMWEGTAYARGGGYAGGVGPLQSVIGVIAAVGLVMLMFISRNFRNAVIGYVLLVGGVAWAFFAVGKEFGNQTAGLLLLALVALVWWYFGRDSDTKPADKKLVQSKEAANSNKLTKASTSTEIKARTAVQRTPEQVNKHKSQQNFPRLSNPVFSSEDKRQDPPRSPSTQLMTFRERAEREKKNLLLRRIFLKAGVVAVLLMSVAVLCFIFFN